MAGRNPKNNKADDGTKKTSESSAKNSTSSRTATRQEFTYTPKHLRNANALGEGSHGYFGQRGWLYDNRAQKYSTLKSETENAVKSAKGNATQKTAALDTDKKLQSKYKKMDRIKKWANPSTARKVGRTGAMVTLGAAGVIYGVHKGKDLFKTSSSNLKTHNNGKEETKKEPTKEEVAAKNKAYEQRKKSTEERNKRMNAGNSNARGGMLNKKNVSANKFKCGGKMKKKK